MNARLVTSIDQSRPVVAVKRLDYQDADENRLILTVNYNGTIAECNRAGSKILGCLPAELIWQPLSRLLPKLKNVALLQGQNINPYLNFLSRAGYMFDLQTVKGAHLLSKVFFCEIGTIGQRFLRVIICPQTQPVQFASAHQAGLNGLI
jgi:PAS domain-containing protein